jgi:hypothetical protein
MGSGERCRLRYEGQSGVGSGFIRVAERGEAGDARLSHLSRGANAPRPTLNPSRGGLRGGRVPLLSRNRPIRKTGEGSVRPISRSALQSPRAVSAWLLHIPSSFVVTP